LFGAKGETYVFPRCDYLRVKRIWTWIVRFTLSPFAEMLTWVGTLFGGIIVSGSGGQLAPILVGAGIVLIAVLPLAIKGAIEWQHSRLDDYRDARESFALEYSATALRLAADLEKLPRATRVAMSEGAVRDCLESVWRDYFEGSTTVRVVLFLVNSTGDSLRVEAFKGRAEEPRAFMAGEPRTGIALAQLRASDDSLYVADKTSLPPEWGADERNYSTFIRLPIRTKSEAYGMLTVDSTNQRDLSKRDASALVVYSTAMAVFLAIAARGEQNRSREGST